MVCINKLEKTAIALNCLLHEAIDFWKETVFCYIRYCNRSLGFRPLAAMVVNMTDFQILACKPVVFLCKKQVSIKHAHKGGEFLKVFLWCTKSLIEQNLIVYLWEFHSVRQYNSLYIAIRLNWKSQVEAMCLTEPWAISVHFRAGIYVMLHHRWTAWGQKYNLPPQHKRGGNW